MQDWDSNWRSSGFTECTNPKISMCLLPPHNRHSSLPRSFWILLTSFLVSNFRMQGNIRKKLAVYQTDYARKFAVVAEQVTAQSVSLLPLSQLDVLWISTVTEPCWGWMMCPGKLYQLSMTFWLKAKPHVFLYLSRCAKLQPKFKSDWKVTELVSWQTVRKLQLCCISSLMCLEISG